MEYIVIKSTRVYYGGPGYLFTPPTSLVVAIQVADYLTDENPVGFRVLPYQPETISHLDEERVNQYNTFN